MPSRNSTDMLIEELGDARERVAALEQQAAEQRARNVTPEEREDALREAEGQALLEAIQAANRKGQLSSVRLG